MRTTEDNVISWAILMSGCIWAVVAFLRELDRQYEQRQKEIEYIRESPENQWWTP